jgi:hypothetical protein
MENNKDKEIRKEDNPNKEIKEKEDLGKNLYNQSRLLGNIFMWLGILILFLVLIFFIINSQNNFEYNGASFKKIKEGDNLIFYQTSIPVLYQGKIIPYNIYLRNNPEKLSKEVPFNGELGDEIFLKNVVVNISGDINCEGHAVLAIANLVELYKDVLGANMIKNESISCEKSGEYMYLNIKEANETNVEQFGPTCYNINFKNCEILKATERFMIETFAELKKVEKAN